MNMRLAGTIATLTSTDLSNLKPGVTVEVEVFGRYMTVVVTKVEKGSKWTSHHD